MMERVKKILKKIGQSLNPLPPIGGLAITDSAIRFFLIEEGGGTRATSLRLPPGIVENGRVKNAGALTQALKKVHNELFPASKTMHVILSLPQRDVYTQVFPLPNLGDEKQLRESAELNLQMISPIDFSSSYSDWQRFGEVKEDEPPAELLGAFTEKEIVDGFAAALTGAHFNIAAVEFPALSLVRLMRIEPIIDGAEPYIVIDSTSDGILFMIVRNNGLYFSHFTSWKSLQEEVGGQKISQEAFQNFLVREVQKLVNFYAGKGSKRLTQLITFSGKLTDEFIRVLEDTVGLHVNIFSSKHFPKAGPAWFSVVGSALRGGMHRSEDKAISLTDAPVQVQYRQARTINFVHLWKKIGITVTGFILILFLGIDSFFANQVKRLEARVPDDTQLIEVNQVIALQESAREFNQLVQLAAATQEGQIDWTGIIERLFATAGQGVELERISFASGRILTSGIAEDETTLLVFKEKLIQDQQFIDILLPLGNIKPNADGSVSFTLSLDLSTP